jgi:ferritin-like protein 2
MNQEFYTSNLYLQLSQRCSENSLNGTALFLRHQAQNTVTQMMRMYEYIKQSGATPVLQEQHARCGEFSTLEDLFEQTVSDYQKRINALTSLTEDAQAANDKSAINFLKRYRKEEIVDGTLLQIILDEVRSAKSGHQHAANRPLSGWRDRSLSLNQFRSTRRFYASSENLFYIRNRGLCQ